MKKATPSSSSSTKVDKGKSSGKTSSTKSTKGGNDQSGNDDAVDAQGGSFLDREISNFHDFLLALSVGVVIGLGIVIGFLLGVLYITSDAAGAANAAKGHLAGKGTGEIRSPPGIPSGESLMNLNRVR
uniref:Uncharacterized protein n=1 Tax=Craspedostauros australis TaxID=1486917 RepID=A0A7R9WR53_9STRA